MQFYLSLANSFLFCFIKLREHVSDTIEKKRKRENLSVGLQVEAVSYKLLIYTLDKIKFYFFVTKDFQKLLRKSLETQGDWIRHHVGDPNQYKNFLSLLLTAVFPSYLFLY